MRSVFLTLIAFVAMASLAPTAMLAQDSAKTPKNTAKKTAEDLKQWCTYLPGKIESAAPDNGKHIVLISGDDEYRSEEALPMLGKILSQRLGFKCTVLFAIDEETGKITPDHQSNIPGMQHLQDCDLVIMALRFRGLPDDQMKFLDEYLMAGKPVIALRTSTHAFHFKDDVETSYRHYDYRGNDKWPLGFGKQLLGETWFNHHGHHGQQSTRGIINKEHAGNVLLKGVTDVWGPTDVYGVRELPEGCNVLLKGQVLDGMEPDDNPAEGELNDPMMALAWTRTWTSPEGNDCPVFCTTMGSSTDFESNDLRRLVINAALQMTGMEDKITDDQDVSYVGEYHPTNFGFGSYTKELTPADYDLK